MFPSRVLLGGGRHFLVPKSVWTPASGWWGSSSGSGSENEQKKATLIAIGLGAVAVSFLYGVSLDKMVRDHRHGAPAAPLGCPFSVRACTLY